MGTPAQNSVFLKYTHQCELHVVRNLLDQMTYFSHGEKHVLIEAVVHVRLWPALDVGYGKSVLFCKLAKSSPSIRAIKGWYVVVPFVSRSHEIVEG